MQGPTRKVALQVAARLEAALPAGTVLGLLQDPDPEVRADACRCAGSWPVVVPVVLDLTRDGEPEVSTAAWCALGRMGRREARPALTRLLRDAPSAAVIEGVAAVADEDGVILLGRIARSQSPLARAALDALQTIEHPRARQIVGDLPLPWPTSEKRSRSPAVSGRTRAPARLAGALLGQLLYETGDVDEATRLLDESYQFGSEGGGVDFTFAARFVVGARIRALHEDRSSAMERLDTGMATAQRLRLPRLAAAVNNERIRLGIQIAPAVAARLRSTRTIPHNDGIATLTAELDEDSAVRLLAAADSPDDKGQACRRAAELVTGIDGQRRPLAALQAELLLIETLTATGRVAEFVRVLRTSRHDAPRWGYRACWLTPDSAKAG